MAYYLVSAKIKKELQGELEIKLKERAFEGLQPFGKTISYGLENARVNSSDKVVWEEEDYCSPPLTQERSAVLDTYFTDLTVQKVNQGHGWKQINLLPKLFP